MGQIVGEVLSAISRRNSEPIFGFLKTKVILNCLERPFLAFKPAGNAMCGRVFEKVQLSGTSSAHIYEFPERTSWCCPCLRECDILRGRAFTPVVLCSVVRFLRRVARWTRAEQHVIVMFLILKTVHKVWFFPLYAARWKLVFWLKTTKAENHLPRPSETLLMNIQWIRELLAVLYWNNKNM